MAGVSNQASEIFHWTWVHRSSRRFARLPIVKCVGEAIRLYLTSKISWRGRSMRTTLNGNSRANVIRSASPSQEGRVLRFHWLAFCAPVCRPFPSQGETTGTGTGGKDALRNCVTSAPCVARARYSPYAIRSDAPSICHQLAAPCELRMRARGRRNALSKIAAPMQLGGAPTMATLASALAHANARREEAAAEGPSE
jgi:hypothetical protein